jgi:hypothetical protein
VSGEEQHGQFLPLSVAAAIAYGSLVRDNEAAHDRARLEAHLNYVAAELASILALFSQIDGAPPEILSPEQVARGKFTQGGQMLHLPGAPEPVSALRVRNADLHLAIEQLRQRLSFPPD